MKTIISIIAVIISSSTSSCGSCTCSSSIELDTVTRSTSYLKSQVVYSKQPKLGLTQEFVVDCAHALWVVHSIKRLVSLMLLKWFLSDSFIYFNENF